jgi:hypothetical protein
VALSTEPDSALRTTELIAKAQRCITREEISELAVLKGLPPDASLKDIIGFEKTWTARLSLSRNDPTDPLIVKYGYLPGQKPIAPREPYSDRGRPFSVLAPQRQ